MWLLCVLKKFALQECLFCARYVQGSDNSVAGDSHLRCDAVSSGEWFPMFWRIFCFCIKEQAVRDLFVDCETLQMKAFIQQYSITYQKTCFFNICPKCSSPYLLLVDSFVLVRKLSAWTMMHVTKLVIWSKIRGRIILNVFFRSNLIVTREMK